MFIKLALSDLRLFAHVVNSRDCTKLKQMFNLFVRYLVVLLENKMVFNPLQIQHVENRKQKTECFFHLKWIISGYYSYKIRNLYL